MRRRHDPFLKRLYRAGIRDALTLFFPDLAARIDWAEWQWLDKEIVIRSREPRSVVADLVGMTRDVEGRYLRVLVHPELQMLPDEEMGWRVTQYNSGLLLYGEVEEMAQTVLERLKAQARQEARLQGRQEGLQEGRQEGRREGEAAGLRKALLGFLSSRFPHMPESMVERVQRLEDVTLLATLIRRAASASSLEEIETLLGS